MANTKPAWTFQGRTGPVRRYKNLEFFACEGLVVMLDNRPSSIAKNDVLVVIRPGDARTRALALNNASRRAVPGDPTWHRRDATALRSGAQDLMDCAKEAYAMGDPGDPQVQLWWKKHGPPGATTQVFGLPLTAGRASEKAAPVVPWSKEVAPELAPIPGSKQEVLGQE